MSPARLRLLVLGGTRFVGRAIVEEAIASGHDVVLFNRGSHRDVLPDVPRLSGDRRSSDDVAQLADQEWDSVIDVSAYHPAEVRTVLHALRSRSPHYVFISTVSVYADSLRPGDDESAALLEVHENIDRSSPRAYGGLKVLCERTVENALGDRLTVLRPTVVIGPHDPTDRFCWYVRAVSRGGEVQLPRRLEQPVQLIDAHDLGRFAVRVAEDRRGGTFNVAGPREPLTLGQMVQTIAEVLGVKWTPSASASGEEFPLTLAENGSEDAFFSVSVAAAVRAGLEHRSLADSTRATRAWMQQQPG